MTRNHWLSVALAALACCGLVNTAQAQQPAGKRPHIVFLLADDLGYGDIACYGAPDTKTPHLDRLAQQGVRFTQAYANGPECSPTRAAFLTGRYKQRVGGLECALGINDVGRYDEAIRLAEAGELGLPPEDSLVPQRLKSAGYKAVIYGKWHLGYRPKFNPLRHGFDEFFGILGGNADYFRHTEESPLHVLYENESPVQRDGYLTHLFTDEAVEFLGRDQPQPFFLFLTYTVPHSPYQGPGDRDVAVTSENWNRGTRAKYVEMVEDMDRQIGRVLKTLDEQKLADDTVVIFASDNGGAGLAHNAPFSGRKSSVFEGGIRVPLVVRWPGRIPAASESHQPTITFDLTASMLRLAGAKPPQDRPLDGMDILQHVEERRPDMARTLFWRGRRGERTEKAVRDGDLKYAHRKLDDGTIEEHLYDLAQDPSEKNNLLADRPQDADRLRSLMGQWEREVQPERGRQ